MWGYMESEVRRQIDNGRQCCMCGVERGFQADRYVFAEFCTDSGWTRLHKLLEADLCAVQLTAHLHSNVSHGTGTVATVRVR